MWRNRRQAATSLQPRRENDGLCGERNVKKRNLWRRRKHLQSERSLRSWNSEKLEKQKWEGQCLQKKLNQRKSCAALSSIWEAFSYLKEMTWHSLWLAEMASVEKLSSLRKYHRGVCSLKTRNDWSWNANSRRNDDSQWKYITWLSNAMARTSVYRNCGYQLERTGLCSGILQKMRRSCIDTLRNNRRLRLTTLCGSLKTGETGCDRRQCGEMPWRNREVIFNKWRNQCYSMAAKWLNGWKYDSPKISNENVNIQAEKPTGSEECLMYSRRREAASELKNPLLISVSGLCDYFILQYRENAFPSLYIFWNLLKRNLTGENTVNGEAKWKATDVKYMKKQILSSHWSSDRLHIHCEMHCFEEKLNSVQSSNEAIWPLIHLHI